MNNVYNDQLNRRLINLDLLAKEKAGQLGLLFGAGQFAAAQQGRREGVELGREAINAAAQQETPEIPFFPFPGFGMEFGPPPGFDNEFGFGEGFEEPPPSEFTGGTGGGFTFLPPKDPGAGTGIRNRAVQPSYSRYSTYYQPSYYSYGW